MNLAQDKIVLLFYKDFERDRFFKNDRYLKRLIRPLYQKFSRGPKVSGFFVWYQLLITALREAGYDVRCNDYRLARRHPEYPVGLVGYPHLLEGWDLPNPAVVGPGFFDHPCQAPELMHDPRFRSYIVTCEWMQALFEPVYKAACVQWHAGMDLNLWPDSAGLPKTLDFLIYDKVRWDRDTYEPGLIDPVRAALDARGLSHETIRYGAYDHALYREKLKSTRALLFLCEHETQGMAYQEAMAADVPVLAWDNGFWLDPNRTRYTKNAVPASSVPYFAPECGERFRDIAAFPDALERFLTRLPGYTPRAYVARELSLEGSARQYLEYYAQAGA